MQKRVSRRFLLEQWYDNELTLEIFTEYIFLWPIYVSTNNNLLYGRTEPSVCDSDSHLAGFYFSCRFHGPIFFF